MDSVGTGKDRRSHRQRSPRLGRQWMTQSTLQAAARTPTQMVGVAMSMRFRSKYRSVIHGASGCIRRPRSLWQSYRRLLRDSPPAKEGGSTPCHSSVQRRRAPTARRCDFLPQCNPTSRYRTLRSIPLPHSHREPGFGHRAKSDRSMPRRSIHCRRIRPPSKTKRTNTRPSSAVRDVKVR